MESFRRQSRGRDCAPTMKVKSVFLRSVPDSPRDVNRVNIDQLRLILNTTEVLWANNQVDLTQEIILSLNKQFATTPPKP